MKIRVTVYSFFFAMYFALRILPSYFSNSLTMFLENIFLVGGLAFLLLKQYKPSKLMKISALYVAFIAIMSFINKTDRADYHLIVSNLKLLTFLAVMEWSITYDTKRTIHIMFSVLLVYTLMDVASIIIFPNGLYFRETVWNEWSTSKYAQWIFGNKNNRVYWYLCLIYLTCWKSINKRSQYSNLLITAITAISLTAMILVDSATSFVVTLVATLGVWWGLLSEKDTKIPLKPQWLYPLYLVFFALWTSGGVMFLRPIVEGLLGRNMSFTNRTIIWGRAFLYILQKPLFGWGQYGAEATTLLGSLAFVNVHNQILDVLWQGGIIGFVLFSGIIVAITKNMEKISNNRYRIFAMFMFAALLVEMLAETVFGIEATWIYLMLSYHFSDFVSKKQVQMNWGQGC